MKNFELARKTSSRTQKSAACASKSKRVLNAVYKTLITGLLLAEATLIGGEVAHAFRAYTNKNYNTAEGIENILEILNTDPFLLDYFQKTTKLKSDFTRLPHNNDHPIYICFSPNISVHEQQVYIKALKYYEGLFSKINPNYNFEVISSVSANAKAALGQTVIFFKEEDSYMFDGRSNQRNNLLNKGFIRRVYIEVALKKEDSSGSKYHIILHELAHAFGFGDVYTEIGGKVHYDTFMQASNTNKQIAMLYPNEVALLHALYNDNLSDAQGKINTNELEKTILMLKEYEVKFYQKVEEVIKHNLNKPHEILPLGDIEENSFWFTPPYQNSEQDCLNYKIEVGKSFEFANLYAFNSEGDLVYNTTTKAIKKGEILYLPSVELKAGEHPYNPYVPSNLFMGIVKTESGYELFDIGGLKSIPLISYEFYNQLKLFTGQKSNYAYDAHNYNYSHNSFEL